MAESKPVMAEHKPVAANHNNAAKELMKSKYFKSSKELKRLSTSKAPHKVTNAFDVFLARWHAGGCLLNSSFQILHVLGLELVVVCNGHCHFQLIGSSGYGMLTSLSGKFQIVT